MSSESSYKLVNSILGSRLLISSLPGSASSRFNKHSRSLGIEQAFLKPCLENFIPKDTHLVFSICQYHCQHFKIYDQIIYYVFHDHANVGEYVHIWQPLGYAKCPLEEIKTGLYLFYTQFRTTLRTGSPEPTLPAYTNDQLRGEYVSIILFFCICDKYQISGAGYNHLC